MGNARVVVIKTGHLCVARKPSAIGVDETDYHRLDVRPARARLVSSASAPTTLYEAAGGMPFFETLVGRFYDAVEADPLLRPVYPAGDLGPARRRLTLFLAQYWGGPTTYDEERGHPRLRMRHAPFAIGSPERDRWLGHMRTAVEASGASSEMMAVLIDYFVPAADAMRNRP